MYYCKAEQARGKPVPQDSHDKARVFLWLIEETVVLKPVQQLSLAHSIQEIPLQVQRFRAGVAASGGTKQAFLEIPVFPIPEAFQSGHTVLLKEPLIELVCLGCPDPPQIPPDIIQGIRVLHIAPAVQAVLEALPQVQQPLVYQQGKVEAVPLPRAGVLEAAAGQLVIAGGPGFQVLRRYGFR